MSKVKFEANFGQAGWAFGSVDGIAAELETGNYVSDMTKQASLYASREIERQLDLLVNGGNHSLEHVYEFKRSGIYHPGDRLFNVYSQGSGAHREVTFKFLPSKKGGPSLRDRIKRGELDVELDDRVFKPGKSGRKVNLDARYTFVNKATILESGTSVMIRPKKGKRIFVPFLAGTTQTGKRPYAFMQSANPNLGATRHTGKFTAAWLIASQAAGVKTGQMIEEQFTKQTKSVRMRRGGVSKKTFGVAFAEGKAMARRQLEALPL